MDIYNRSEPHLWNNSFLNYKQVVFLLSFFLFLFFFKKELIDMDNAVVIAGEGVGKRG